MKPRFIAGVLLSLLFVTTTFFGADVLWEGKIKKGVIYKHVDPSGIIIVGAEKTLYGFETESGKELWSVPIQKGYKPEDMKPLPGTTNLIYVYQPSLTKPPILHCIDIATGKELWKTDHQSDVPSIEWAAKASGKSAEKLQAYAGQMAGKYKKLFLQLGFYGGVNSIAYDKERNQYIVGTPSATLAINFKPTMLGPGFAGIDATTGKINFLYNYPKASKSFVTDNPPIVSGDTVIADWAGMHTFSAVDGTPLVATPFDRSLTMRVKLNKVVLHGTHATSVANETTAFIPAENGIKAVDIKTGEIKWEHDLGSNVSDLDLKGDRLIMKLGGVYSHQSGKKTIVKETDAGFAFIDVASGEILSSSKTLGEKLTQITPILVDGDKALFATNSTFKAVDLSDPSKYLFNVQLKQEKGDTPKLVVKQDDYYAVCQTQTTSAFNDTGEELWSKSYKAPGLSKLEKIALAGATALSAAHAQGRANATGRSQSYQNLTPMMSKRFSAAQATGQYNYVLTTLEKKPAIVGINLKTGKANRIVRMTKRNPDYIVDELGGLLVDVHKKGGFQVIRFDTEEDIAAN